MGYRQVSICPCFYFEPLTTDTQESSARCGGLKEGESITYSVARLVDVSADNVDNIITRVPISTNRVPHPDQVVELVMVSEAVVHDVVQLLAGIRPLRSPPEPLPLRLVQRPPEHSDAGILQPQQLGSNGVEITDDEGVVCVGVVGKGVGNVEVCRISVEALVPGLLGGVVETRWGIPVPHYGRDAALCLSVLEDVFDGGGGGSVLDAGRRVVHEILGHEGGSLTGLRLDPVGPLDLLLAGEDVLSIDGLEVVVELCRDGGSVGVDEGRVDGVGTTLLGGGDADGVDGVVAPVADDVDGVVAGVEEDLAALCVDEAVGAGEGDFAAGAAVEDD